MLRQGPTLHESQCEAGGGRQRDARDCPCGAPASAATARPESIARPSTTRIASCSCNKNIKPTPLCKSVQLEAEHIYETRSNIIALCGLPAKHTAIHVRRFRGCASPCVQARSLPAALAQFVPKLTILQNAQGRTG